MIDGLATKYSFIMVTIAYNFNSRKYLTTVCVPDVTTYGEYSTETTVTNTGRTELFELSINPANGYIALDKDDGYIAQIMGFRKAMN